MDCDIKGKVLVKYTGNDKEVVIPEAVEVIGERAFEGNDNIERVTFGENVEFIQPQAFMNCNNLVEVVFLGKIRDIGSCAFQGCSSIDAITLPQGLRTIKYGIFEDCTNLRKVIIPEGVERIEDFAFGGFMPTPLEELVLPDSVCYLGHSNISCGGYDKKPDDILYKRIHLGKGLKTIGANNPNYYEFENIEFDSDFSNVFDKKCCGAVEEDPVFEYKLYTDFSIDEDNPYFTYKDGLLLSKDEKILFSCMMDHVEEIVVPNGVEKIMGHTFMNVNCGRLVIPESVKSMKGSFVEATIDTLVLSEGITEIPDQAFLKSKIKNLIVPNSLKKMQGYVFLDTYCLKNLKLPKGIEFGKYNYSDYGVPFTDRTPFWFNPDAGFNDLEFVEVIDSDRNTISRLGILSDKELRRTKESFHYLLDEFLRNDGVVSGTSMTRIYRELKNKQSKLRLLYGVLTSELINDKNVGKLIVPDIIKNKKALREMATEKQDKETESRLEEVLESNKK